MPGLGTAGIIGNMKGWLGKLFGTEPERDALGQRGENVAARFLRNRNFRIIERNFRCDLGEIDIIARDGRTLVFVEVKTREDDEPAPEEQVNNVKQHQITKAAKFYLTRYGTPQPPARFDVVAMRAVDGMGTALVEGGRVALTHISWSGISWRASSSANGRGT